MLYEYIDALQKTIRNYSPKSKTFAYDVQINAQIVDTIESKLTNKPMRKPFRIIMTGGDVAAEILDEYNSTLEEILNDIRDNNELKELFESNDTKEKFYIVRNSIDSLRSYIKVLSQVIKDDKLTDMLTLLNRTKTVIDNYKIPTREKYLDDENVKIDVSGLFYELLTVIYNSGIFIDESEKALLDETFRNEHNKYYHNEHMVQKIADITNVVTLGGRNFLLNLLGPKYNIIKNNLNIVKLICTKKTYRNEHEIEEIFSSDVPNIAQDTTTGEYTFDFTPRVINDIDKITIVDDDIDGLKNKILEIYGAIREAKQIYDFVKKIDVKYVNINGVFNCMFNGLTYEEFVTFFTNVSVGTQSNMIIIMMHLVLNTYMSTYPTALPTILFPPYLDITKNKPFEFVICNEKYKVAIPAPAAENSVVHVPIGTTYMVNIDEDGNVVRDDVKDQIIDSKIKEKKPTVAAREGLDVTKPMVTALALEEATEEFKNEYESSDVTKYFLKMLSDLDKHCDKIKQIYGVFNKIVSTLKNNESIVPDYTNPHKRAIWPVISSQMENHVERIGEDTGLLFEDENDQNIYITYIYLQNKPYDHSKLLPHDYGIRDKYCTSVFQDCVVP
jgi:hypothetical protein